MPLPPYIRRLSFQVYPPPYSANGVQYYGFLLPADSATIQSSFIDATLNAVPGSDLRFRNAMPAIMLTCINIDALSSTDPAFSNYGHYPEQETALWVLAEEENSKKLYFLPAYIFVNNPLAIAMGREAYGFPKEAGWFDIPNDLTTVGLLTVDAIAVRQYSSHATGRRQRLIDIQRTFTDTNAPVNDACQSIEAILYEMQDMEELICIDNSLTTDLVLALHTGEDILNERVNLALLKEFRDAKKNNLACYQAIIEAEIRVNKFRSGCFLPNDFEITIHPFESHPIHQQFGLATGPIKPILGVSACFDFVIDKGKEVYRVHTT